MKSKWKNIIILNMMEEENRDYFKSALSDFAFDVACGAQIRHLADLGYTARQITAELDVSVPYERVRKAVTEYLRTAGILVSDRPDIGSCGKPKFVREYDSYGRPSFRRVVAKEQMAAVCWQEQAYVPVPGEDLFHFLNKKTEENGEDFSYISCDFGIDEEKTKHSLKVLNQRQQEYIEGILWEKSRMYHRLTSNMQVIMSRLYENGFYEGECYFKKTGDCVIL